MNIIPRRNRAAPVDFDRLERDIREPVIQGEPPVNQYAPPARLNVVETVEQSCAAFGENSERVLSHLETQIDQKEKELAALQEQLSAVKDHFRTFGLRFAKIDEPSPVQPNEN